MGHPGNWSERKRADVRSENARADREALKTATFEQHGARGYKLTELHPCETKRLQWGVTATCMGCLEQRWITLDALLTSPLAHAPWPRVMRALTCAKCGSCAGGLYFDRSNFNGVGRFAIGALIARTVPDGSCEIR